MWFHRNPWRAQECFRDSQEIPGAFQGVSGGFRRDFRESQGVSRRVAKALRSLRGIRRI